MQVLDILRIFSSHNRNVQVDRKQSYEEHCFQKREKLLQVWEKHTFFSFGAVTDYKARAKLLDIEISITSNAYKTKCCFEQAVISRYFEYEEEQKCSHHIRDNLLDTLRDIPGCDIIREYLGFFSHSFILSAFATETALAQSLEMLGVPYDSDVLESETLRTEEFIERDVIEKLYRQGLKVKLTKQYARFNHVFETLINIAVPNPPRLLTNAAYYPLLKFSLIEDFVHSELCNATLATQFIYHSYLCDLPLNEKLLSALLPAILLKDKASILERIKDAFCFNKISIFRALCHSEKFKKETASVGINNPDISLNQLIRQLIFKFQSHKVKAMCHLYYQPEIARMYRIPKLEFAFMQSPLMSAILFSSIDSIDKLKIDLSSGQAQYLLNALITACETEKELFMTEDHLTNYSPLLKFLVAHGANIEKKMIKKAKHARCYYLAHDLKKAYRSQ